MKIKLNDGVEEVLNGEYLVVDPCYLIRGGDSWEKVNSLFFDTDDTDNNWLLVDGYLMFMWSTSDGDGSYPVYLNGKEIGKSTVDSGTLAFIPTELVNKTLSKTKKSEREIMAGVVVTLDKVEPDLAHGDVHAGDIEVYTSPEDPYAQAEEERQRLEDQEEEDNDRRDLEEWRRHQDES